MIQPRSLFVQVSLTMIGALALVVAIGLVALHLLDARGERQSGYRLPLPARVAAITEVVERTDPADLPVLLNALSSSSLTISVSEEPVAISEAETVHMPVVRWLFDDYLRALGGRSIALVSHREAITPRADVRREANAVLTNWPVALVVTLADGRALTIEPHGDLLSYLLGLRLSIAALLALAGITVLALWVLRRQVRPLVRLAQAVEQFGDRPDAEPLEATGATEVRQLVGALNRMRQRIGTLLVARTHLIAAISHDLGTYLTRLRLRAEFIVDDQQQQRAVRDLDEMHALLQDTLTLARLDTRKPQDAVWLDIRAIAERVVDGETELGRAVRLAHGHSVMLRGYEPPLRRLLANLIENALKYGNEAFVNINIVAAVDAADFPAGHNSAEVVEILVEDRGPGIAEADRAVVLEPFTRGDMARNLDRPGSGLGLSIVAEVARLHRGAVTFEDRDGGGLCVRVRLRGVA